MISSGSLVEWIVFGVLVVGMLGLDLVVFQRHGSKPSTHLFRQAVIWSIVWIALALLFNGYVLLTSVMRGEGTEAGVNFFTAYIVEKSLSVDNLFVFLAIFNYFRIPEPYQHRVLFWGVFTALILRGIFIFGGTLLLSAFHWMFYVFGAFLVFTGIKLIFQKSEDVDPEKKLVVRLIRRYLPLHPQLDGNHFFTLQNGKRMATPLLLVLIAIEFTDVLFATDSVPAVLGITDDVFIVYSSNIFAILGLRALYFVIAGMLVKIHYLNYGLAAVLSFIGLKMMLVDIFHIPVLLSLGVIGGLLVISIVASVFRSRLEARQDPH